MLALLGLLDALLDDLNGLATRAFLLDAVLADGVDELDDFEHAAVSDLLRLQLHQALCYGLLLLRTLAIFLLRQGLHVVGMLDEACDRRDQALYRL